MNKKIKLIICGIVAASIIGISAYSINASKNNTKNIVDKILDVSYGTANLAIVTPKDVLAEAVKMEAPKIILVHNHPSGDPMPSKADMEFTDRLIAASKLLGVELLDHIVIGHDSYESIFYRKGLEN